MSISRRKFLKSLGVAAASASVPFFPVLSYAQEAFPKRFVVFFSANGTIHEEWAPSGGERDFVFKEILAPLEDHRDDIIVVDELVMSTARNGPGDDHQKGMGHMLTGVQLLDGNEFPGCGGDCNGSGWGGGISIDQFVANAVGGNTLFPSLEFGVQVRSNNVWSRMSYRGANEPIPAEDDPWAMADRVFGSIGQDPFGLETSRREQQTVLNALKDDFDVISGKVSGEDRVKMQAHLEAVYELERRLDVNNGLGEYCVVPDIGDSIDIYANDNFPGIGRTQMDLLAMSLACNLTQVASIQWSRAVSNVQHNWLGITEGHHDLSHEPDDNGQATAKIVQVNRWYAEQFAYLIQKLKDIPEGDGTLLDNTTIIWVNELAKGNRHSHDPQPVVLAGSGGGYFDTGRYVKTGGAAHNDVLTSICRMMGLDNVDKFGDPSFTNGPLDSLTA